MTKSSVLFSLALLPAFVACSAAPVPIGTQGFSASRARSGAAAGDLIYASGYSDSKGAEVFMLTYPQGQLVGSIPLGVSGMCPDGSGNVYLLYRNSAIEYPHGETSPTRTLKIPGAEMISCAVDPSSGNVATTFSCPPCGYQNLAIFPPGSGTPTRYMAPAGYSSTYDSQGDLFLGGIGSTLVELPAGSNAFTTVNVDKDLGDAGQVQWDGTYVTVQSLEETSGRPGGIYRIDVSGSTGTVVGETTFGRYRRREGYSWISISHGTVLMPFSQHGSQTNQLGIWKYPRGGKATRVIKKIGAGNQGFSYVTVSDAPTR